MEDKQKLNLLRLSVDNASSFGEAKAYASFICGFKEPFETRTPSDGEEEVRKHEYIETIIEDGVYIVEDEEEEYIEPIIEDGVYIVEDGFLPVRFKDVAWALNRNKCNVMVSYHGHKWIVAKEDLKGDKLPLFSNDSNPEDTSSFYKCEIEALNDFDMKSCTENLRKAGIAFELDADLYIPTAGQLAAMFLFRKELNKALEMAGGTQMKEEVYWSSSEVSANYSWYVYFSDGAVNYNLGYRYYSNYVRPCKVFELRNK